MSNCSSICAREPVQRPTLRMCDRYDEQMGLVLLEREDVRKAMEDRSANQRFPAAEVGPRRIGSRGVTDSIERRRHFRDELDPEALPLFLVPDCRAPKFGAGVRV